MTTGLTPVQATPFIALLLFPNAQSRLETDFLALSPPPFKDHALKAGLTLYDALKSLELDPPAPMSHVRMDMHPSILQAEGRLSTRHFYKWINDQYAPSQDIESYVTSNAFFPFQNAEIWVPRARIPGAAPPNGGYVRVDYRLPTDLANLLEMKVIKSALFNSGMITYVELNQISKYDSYFVQPTREAYSQQRANGPPQRY